MTAAQADFDRRDVLRRAVQTLVDNQLRPGAEASRADAERAAAQTRLIQAQQAVTLAQTTLMRVLGVTTRPVAVAGRRVAASHASSGPAGWATRPRIRSRRSHQAAVDQARAQEDVLARTDCPRVYLQSSVFARGSGANPNGVLDGGVDGLGLERANWAAGVQVVFPNRVRLLESARAQGGGRGIDAARKRPCTTRRCSTVTSSSRRPRRCSRRRAPSPRIRPIQLAAAQQSEAQARARYNAGLASIVEVADAQSLLAQAEVAGSARARRRLARAARSRRSRRAT